MAPKVRPFFRGGVTVWCIVFFSTERGKKL
jgi:hypothetical protein